jgi:hypothetical protein
MALWEEKRFFRDFENFKEMAPLSKAKYFKLKNWEKCFGLERGAISL